jgi:hypothetical protein
MLSQGFIRNFFRHNNRCTCLVGRLSGISGQTSTGCLEYTLVFRQSIVCGFPSALMAPNFVFDGWVPSCTGIHRLLRRDAVTPSPRSLLDGVAPQCTVRGPGVAARGCIAPSPIVLDAHRPSGTLGCPLFRRPAVKRHRLDASRRGVEHPVRHGLDGAQPSWQGLGHPVTPPRRRAPSEDGIDGTWPSSPLARWTFPARSRRVPRCAAFSGARPSSTP